MYGLYWFIGIILLIAAVLVWLDAYLKRRRKGELDLFAAKNLIVLGLGGLLLAVLGLASKLFGVPAADMTEVQYYLSNRFRWEIGPSIRALLGLRELITNVNIPNRGQIPNLPMDAVVETNAVFRDNSVMPVQAGNIPDPIFGLISRICAEQELVNEGVAERNLTKIFNAFVADPLVTCSYDDARKMFKEMCENTKEYLTMYDLSQL